MNILQHGIIQKTENNTCTFVKEYQKNVHVFYVNIFFRDKILFQNNMMEKLHPI